MLFRAILAIPHYIWSNVFQLAVFGILYVGLALFAWFTLLIWGRLDDDVHSVMARFLRYQAHLYAYLALLADPYPPFRGHAGAYPIDLEVGPPQPQARWVTFFRLILAIPAIIFASVLSIVLFTIAFTGWFAALAAGRMPQGMRDLGAYCLRYSLQTGAYVLLLTDRYPTLASAEVRDEPDAGGELEAIGEPEAGGEPATVSEHAKLTVSDDVKLTVSEHVKATEEPEVRDEREVRDAREVRDEPSA